MSTRPRAAALARGRRVSPLIVASLAFILSLGLYALTASRGVEWQDSGFHQYRIISGQLEHPLGLALAHPLHFWCGRAALAVPYGDPFWRLNLLSALCGALGVAGVATLTATMTRSAAASGIAAVSVGLAHSFWQMSAQTETYTLAAALMTIEWLLLWRFARSGHAGWLAAVFLANGLHVADHMLGTLTLATYGVLLLERIARGRVRAVWLPICAALWIIGASPYLALIADHYVQGGSLVATLRSALFGGSATNQGWAGDVLNVAPGGRQLALAVMTLGYCFPSLALFVALAGLTRRTRGRRRLFLWVIAAQTALVFAFVFRYSIKDLYTYFVPVCVLTAVWVGVGVPALRRSLRRVCPRAALHAALVCSAILPIGVYLVFPGVAESRGWMRSQLRELPFRNAYTHFFRPWRMLDDSPERCAAAAIREAGEGGWILADSTPGPMIAAAIIRARGVSSEAAPRVYWTLNRSCLFPLGSPAYGDVDLVRQLRSGGRIIAIPSRDIERLAPPVVTVERSTPFWRLTIGG